MLEGEVGRTEVLVSWQWSYRRLWDQLSRVGPAKPPPTPTAPLASPKLPHGAGCAITARPCCPQDSAYCYFRIAEQLSLV